MTWFATASGKRGRSPKFSDAAIQFCLTLKNLFGLALRQATGLVDSVLQLSGLSWPTPNFSTLSRRQQTLNVQIPYTRSSAGLHLLVDSTGIKLLGEGEWKSKKHGIEYLRQWKKLHIGIDAHTMQIRAICVTSKNIRSRRTHQIHRGLTGQALTHRLIITRAAPATKPNLAW